MNNGTALKVAAVQMEPRLLMNNGTALKVAAVQMEPRLLDKERNLARCLEFARTAAAEGARLIVLPECALTGYVFHSLEEALPVCEAVPGPSTERIAGLCRDLDVHIVVGLLETDGDKHYNTAVLLGPEGIAGRYRKIHLPYLGIDRFLDHGDSAPAVFDTAIARIGIGICYDAMFPEHARVRTGRSTGSSYRSISSPRGRRKTASSSWPRTGSARRGAPGSSATASSPTAPGARRWRREDPTRRQSSTLRSIRPWPGRST